MKEHINFVRKELQKYINEERREKSKTYYPTSMEVLGVAQPDIRKVVKELKARIKGFDERQLITLAKEFVNQNIFECQQVGYELIAKSKKALAVLTFDDIEELRKGQDNWASVDSFSCYIAGVVWREGRIPQEIIIEWAHSANRWERRTAVVCTLAFNQKARGGTGNAERTLEICKLVAADHDDMVVKALSWALRGLGERLPDPVWAFLDEYDEALHPRVKREVRKKLETGKKNG